MTLLQYIKKIDTLFQSGKSTEHSYRGDLQHVLSTMLPHVLVTNEPKRIQCGAPDYILTRNDIPLGYIEAKDVGVKLTDNKALKEQFERYKTSLSNLIFTDYLDFHFSPNGSCVETVAIAEIRDKRIVAKPENFDKFMALIQAFAESISQSIQSPSKLAQMMASRAKFMANVIEQTLNEDDANEVESDLKAQKRAFQELLIHDIKNREFADIYAQTIAYGLFAARYHDPTLPTFSRQEAATLIPKTNPFLRKLFQNIAGYDLDERLVWIVDELVQIFLATDVADIMQNFGKSTRQEDPVIHFYETFLAEYDPTLRKARGVWYTPEPVIDEHEMHSVPWKPLEPQQPSYFLVQKDFSEAESYEKGFKVSELFEINTSGIKTHRDHFVIDFEKAKLNERIRTFLDPQFSDEETATRFNLKDNRDWSVSNARKSDYAPEKIKRILYRPFDSRYIYYDSGMIDFGREKVMRHLLNKNMGLILVPQPQAANLNYFDSVFLTNKFCDTNMFRRGGPFFFPLYLYPEASSTDLFAETMRQPNLNAKIVQRMASDLGLLSIPEKEHDEGNVCLAHVAEVSATYRLTFAPLDILDYIYAILHSCKYRERYKEFLKIDFPRVPYPTDSMQFWELVALGGQLRKLHLLECSDLDDFITTYPEDGTNCVEKVRYEATGETGNVWINEAQYFGGVPETAWNFQIGGYQSAQKWLKDRKDRMLNLDDILHYQRMIVALVTTDRLMHDIDTRY